jgi:hypothetical protein
MAVTFTFSMKGSLMMFTVNPCLFITFVAVSLRLPGSRSLHAKEMIGG